MRKQFLLSLGLLSAFLYCSSFSLHALKPKSKYFRSEEDANIYLTMRYNRGCQYYNEEKWSKSASEFEKVIFYFPSSDAAAEASYYLGVSYFEMKEYDFANEEFSNYLKASQHPAFFEDAVYYKFCIAEHFKGGKKKRPFKMRYLPKWVSAQDSALTIYDEVVAALPNHELTIQALYSKGNLLKEMREYRECVEAYQTIIRRFPKHEIVPDCYLKIADAYVEQSQIESQNPDILALAELNVRKFKEDFPRDERIAIAEGSIYRIKEIYARGLYELGRFYERTHHPDAAAIYYQSSIEEFPDTQVAQLCRSRLICLEYLKEEPAPCVEETAPLIPNEACVAPQEFSIKAAPIYDETNLPQEQIETESTEYVHYSLIKKREAQEACREPESCYAEVYTQWIVENPTQSPCPENHSNEQPLNLWHYSAIKHRDQYVPDQD
jgi:TolA-binding protein